MKILHIIGSISVVRGGPSQAIIEMVKVLRDRSIDVAIVTTNDNGETVLDVSTDGWVNYLDVPVRFFSKFSSRSRTVREFIFSSKLTQWLWHHIQEYDLIHIHGFFSYPTIIAMVIARIYGVPYVVGTHGLLCHWALQQSAMKKTIYLRLLGRANLDKSAGLHLNSCKEQVEADELNLHCPSFVIPHGLQPSQIVSNANERLRSYYNLPTDESIILFLSRLHPVKGLKYLIQALASLHGQRFTFIVAGNGDESYEEQIRHDLQEYNLQNRTILTGFVEGELKQLLLQGADLFVLTSYSENFGLAVLEALAAGTPVLVTPGVALAAEVEKHALGYVVPQEVSAIAEALIQHLRLSAQQQAILRQKAYKFVLENYTWDKIAINLIEVYQAILHRESIPQVLLGTSSSHSDQ